MKSSLVFAVLIVIGMMVQNVAAQTTALAYQGNLRSAGAPANGPHDFEFALFDSASGGLQVGTTVALNAVAVNAGGFSVELDFGAQFPGAARFLEIRVRTTGGGAFTTLTPRQAIVSAPYSIKSASADAAANAANAANSLQLGGVAWTQYVLTGDPRLSDARTPTPGNASYIQNRTTQQTTSNFNISGTGSANVFSAATQYNLGGSRIISAPGTANTFIGIDSGTSNTGPSNSFVGFNAGNANTAGGLNTFVGAGAGTANNTGSENSFFGEHAGRLNTTGKGNTFIGRTAGQANVSGDSNTIVGATANVGSANLNFATAIGAGTTVSTSNTVVLGRSIDTVTVPGTFAGGTVNLSALKVSANGGNVIAGDAGCSAGFTGVGFAPALTACGNYSLLGNGTDTILNRPTGGRIFFRENNSTQLTLTPGGNLGIGTTVPTQKLHVNGNSRLDGDVTFGGSIQVAQPSVFEKDLNVVLGATVGTSLAVGTTITASGAVNTASRYNINGNLALTRSRLDLFNSDATPRGYSLEAPNGSNNVLVLKNDAGVQLITIRQDGNVGIGDINPSGAKLEIGGTLMVANLGGNVGDHLCREQNNLIRVCGSGIGENGPSKSKYDVKIEALEEMVRRQHAEIERQRNELASLKSFICSQSGSAAICRGPIREEN